MAKILIVEARFYDENGRQLYEADVPRVRGSRLPLPFEVLGGGR